MMHQGQLRFTNAKAVTTSDTVANHFLGFMATVAGTMTIAPKDAVADVQITVLAGVVYPIEVLFIRATGTAATGIIGLS